MTPTALKDLLLGHVYLCLRKDGLVCYYSFAERNGNKHYGEQVNRYGQFEQGMRPGLSKLYSHSEYYAVDSEFEINHSFNTNK